MANLRCFIFSQSIQTLPLPDRFLQNRRQTFIHQTCYHSTPQPDNCTVNYKAEPQTRSSDFAHAIDIWLYSIVILDTGFPPRHRFSHLDTGFSWFPCVYNRMVKWFPSFQVASTCFSCSTPELNFLGTYICVHVK